MFKMTGTAYLRVVFTAYWTDSMPSTELFFLNVPPMPVGLSGIANLERTILMILKAHNHSRAQQVIYVGFSVVELTESEINALTWRIVPGLDLAGTRE